MKGLKRTTAWALAALMCASSLLQPVTVTAATDNSVVAEETDQSSVSPESDGKKTEVLEFAETETEHTLNVTILNGNGKLIFHDEETGYEKEIFKNSEGSGLFPIPLIISVDELQLEVVPETGYEVALYKTKIDGGAVQEEITDTALLNQEGNYKTKVNTGEITEIEVAFQEKPMEEAEAPQPENQPEEKVTEKPAENSLEDEPFYNQEVKEILGGMEADLSIVPPTEEENTACNEAFSSDLQEGVGFFSAQEYDDVGAIGSTQYCGSLTTDNDWEHAEIKVYDYWDGYESGWAEVDSWQRGVIGTHGIPAYCTEPGVHYENEDRLVHNARDYYSQNIITLLGLVCKYIEDIPDDEFMIGAQEGGKDISQVYAGKYYVKQVLIWNIMERYYPHYGQYHNIQFEISNAYISASYIGSLISLALQFADLNSVC